EERLPEPRSAAVEHVLFGESRIVSTEQARPGDEPAEDQVRRAAHDDHRAGRYRDGPAGRVALAVVDPHEYRGRGEQRYEGGGTAKRSPLVPERCVRLRRRKALAGPVGGSVHRSSLLMPL